MIVSSYSGNKRQNLSDQKYPSLSVQELRGVDRNPWQSTRDIATYGLNRPRSQWLCFSLQHQAQAGGPCNQVLLITKIFSPIAKKKYLSKIITSQKWATCSIKFIRRPGRSQGLLYKHLPNSLPDSLILQSPIALRRRHAQTVRDSSSIYKIDYVIVIKNFLNPEKHQNPTTALVQKLRPFQ